MFADGWPISQGRQAPAIVIALPRLEVLANVFDVSMFLNNVAEAAYRMY